MLTIVETHIVVRNSIESKFFLRSDNAMDKLEVKFSKLILFANNLHSIKDLVPWQDRRSKVAIPFNWTSGLGLPFIEKKPIIVFSSKFQGVDG